MRDGAASTTFPEVHKGGLVSNAPVDHVARIELVRLVLIAHRVELPESIQAVIFAHLEVVSSALRLARSLSHTGIEATTYWQEFASSYTSGAG
jgi:hypothetical protein